MLFLGRLRFGVGFLLWGYSIIGAYVWVGVYVWVGACVCVYMEIYTLFLGRIYSVSYIFM